MAKLFLSHSSFDNAKALALAKWLEQNGWNDYFLDISLSHGRQRGLMPGERWQKALKAAADRCQAVLFLISNAWLNSNWCKAEFLLAQTLGKNIFGVLVETVDFDTIPKEMTSEWQLCDLVKGKERLFFEVARDPIVAPTTIDFSQSGLNELRIGLQNAGLDPADFPWPPDEEPNRAPYRGLKAYQPQDAAVFFGRETAIVRGLDQLRQMREHRIKKMFIILGASGAGKSSFTRAGLWPRLERDDRHFYPLPIIRPRRAPISGSEGLITSFEMAMSRANIPCTRTKIRDGVATTEGFLQLLEKLAAAKRKTFLNKKWDPTFLLCIDQFEELYGSRVDTESEVLRQLLAELFAKPTRNANAVASQTANMILIATIRTDLYEHLQSDRYLASLDRRFLDLAPMDRSKYERVITGPIQRLNDAGIDFSFDPQLTEQLLKETRGADALPLLAFTLERLFVESGGDGDLRLEEYQAMGGISGVIEAAVEAALADPERSPVIPFDKKEQQRRLRDAFIPWLAEVDERTGERRRCIVVWDSLPKASQAIIERLIEMRLLTRDRRKNEDDNSEEIVVEITHEAVLRRWSLLVEWLDESEEDLKTAASIIHAAQIWADHASAGEDNQEWLTHSGGRLLEAVRLLESNAAFKGKVGDVGSKYLKQCRKRENEEIEREKQQLEKVRQQQGVIAKEQTQRKRQLKWASAVVLLLLMAGISIGALAVQKLRDAGRLQSRVLATSAIQMTRNDDDAHALRFGVLAAKENWIEPVDALGEVALASAASQTRIRHILKGHTGAIFYGEFSPDGSRVITASWDKTARLWDAHSGEPMGKPMVHEDGVYHAAFSPDGSRVITASRDNTARLWDAHSGEPMGKPMAHEEQVNNAAFSPDGSRVVTASDDHRARLWDVKSGKLIGKPMAHDGEVYHAAFSPKGSVVTASRDNTAQLWDAKSGEPIGKPMVHGSTVNQAAFSPDGSRVVTASVDSMAQLWDVSWLTLYHGDELIRAVCHKWQSDVTTLTEADTIEAPLLQGRQGEDVCEGYR